jgi:hypothetical protein
MSDEEYWAFRADVEWRLAAEAINPAVAAVHRELAGRYEELVYPEAEPLLRMSG